MDEGRQKGWPAGDLHGHLPWEREFRHLVSSAKIPCSGKFSARRQWKLCGPISYSCRRKPPPSLRSDPRPA